MCGLNSPNVKEIPCFFEDNPSRNVHEFDK